MIEHVQDLQREHFFAPGSQIPKKPWISSTKWALIKNTPGIRNLAVWGWQQAQRLLLQRGLQAWAGHLRSPASP
eukprot:8794658-Pyramimonas_sp.AAC.1